MLQKFDIQGQKVGCEIKHAYKFYDVILSYKNLLFILLFDFFAPLPIGIGNIPDAVLAELTNHKDLGIHSEMFAGGIVDLVNKGCITNNHKTINKGKIIGSFLIGTRALYDFVDNNPYVGK